ncbi:hypothetical protein [Clostridium saccharobutylicum]|uniref:Uncharacterized protein n=1 Tax=Clostridium saccharobutylicum DSM 13864 TaxID=1345695 RepID=U5MPY0_CLOSA|nr:hypothetical protein [Clostridium saccharobutylicum]AGX42568.1 hypothetical protein CLSA_c15690 [Clostridium saccharobutylicum DSM 13864]AQR89854.1 hypothetical protein CLOSC_15590 [Clostridium saccharobutylicum]AQR99758.1 hypothetical protein CSACC_15670 [Clostridium saccharobutylicum]AQS13742.1 hypothetical protein CLOSACC_15670 [Clostridium saccharobutylicum]MBA2904856.1 hypothetical protein [Clostridium saccharobutylicum]
MNDNIRNEDFYKNLSELVKSRIDNFYNSCIHYEFITKLCIILYCIVTATFFYKFKYVFFTNANIYDLSSIIYISKNIIILSAAIFIINQIPKESKANLDKAFINLKQCLLMDMCTCTEKCTCRNSLISYFKKQGYNLLK